jgi:hypothetical protein
VSKQCPTCSNRKESFFADGTICPTCGRRASLFLDDIGYSSGIRFDEIESLKTALRIKTEEHDCCAEDNITLRKQLAACKRRSHAASQHYAQQLREALESIAKNTCCDRCQEAALVARKALAAIDAAMEAQK